MRSAPLTSSSVAQAQSEAHASSGEIFAPGRSLPQKVGAKKKCMLSTIIQEVLMLSIFRTLMRRDDGATAIEYTLIASLIAVAAIAAMQTVGGKVNNVLANVANAMG